MKQLWSDILNSALIGTDKRPFNVNVLPVTVRKELELLGESNNEKKLLDAAVMLYFYNIAGSKPVKYNGDLSYNPIQEQRSTISIKIKQVFDRITETGYYEKEYLLLLWLDKILKLENIVTPDIMVPLIKLGIGMTKTTRAKIYTVIGERGKMLLPLIPEFIIPSATPNITTEWKEGNPDERRAFVSELRKKNADDALALIQSDWNTENVVFKKSLIELISTDSNTSEYKFLSDLYYNEFSAKSKEKKTETDCRYLLATTLLKDRHSRLYQYTIDHLIQYITEEKKSGLLGFLGGNKEKVFKFPQKNDDFFTGENMVNTYGINAKNPDPAMYLTDALFWFSELLTMMPIQSINDILSKDTDATFQYLTTHEDFKVKIEGKSVPVLLPALENNIRTHKDPRLLLLTLEKSIHPDKYSLLQYAPVQEFEDYIIKEKLFLNGQAINHHPAGDEEWSLKFSEKMLDATYQSLVVNKQHYYYDRINQLMAKHLHPSAISKLESYNQSNGNDNFKEYWIKNIYQPVKTCIEIKSSISQF
jgi:hypothetical protein